MALVVVLWAQEIRGVILNQDRRHEELVDDANGVHEHRAPFLSPDKSHRPCASKKERLHELSKLQLDQRFRIPVKFDLIGDPNVVEQHNRLFPPWSTVQRRLFLDKEVQSDGSGD